MSCPWRPLATTPLPSFFPSPSPSRPKSLLIISKSQQPTEHKASNDLFRKPISFFPLEKTSLAVQIGALIAAVEQPVLAVTGENNNFDDDFTWNLISAAIVAFGYFLVVPPVIMNWMRLRWKQRKLWEMYLQFMFVFIFFPGLLLWAPFLNFRKFPRDPTMKYPWSTPQDLK